MDLAKKLSLQLPRFGVRFKDQTGKLGSPLRSDLAREKKSQEIFLERTHLNSLESTKISQKGWNEPT
jgi:hypothetical protein